MQELVARNEYQDWDYKIHFWHTKSHKEVDFILYGPRGLKAVEVKSGARLREQDFEGLLEFKKDYPKADLILVHGGFEKKIFKDIQIVPAEEFLLQADHWV